MPKKTLHRVQEQGPIPWAFFVQDIDNAFEEGIDCDLKQEILDGADLHSKSVYDYTDLDINYFHADRKRAYARVVFRHISSSEELIYYDIR